MHGQPGTAPVYFAESSIPDTTPSSPHVEHCWKLLSNNPRTSPQVTVQTTDVTATPKPSHPAKPANTHHPRQRQAAKPASDPPTAIDAANQPLSGKPQPQQPAKGHTKKYRLPREINLRTAKCHARGTRPAAAKPI